MIHNYLEYKKDFYDPNKYFSFVLHIKLDITAVTFTINKLISMAKIYGISGGRIWLNAKMKNI